MSYFVMIIMLIMSIIFAQEGFIFDGQADLIEADNIKAKALELARNRAMRKALEYAGVDISSTSIVKDQVIEFDQVISDAQGILEKVTEIYADWDRGDTSRVLVILQAKVRNQNATDITKQEYIQDLKNKIAHQMKQTAGHPKYKRKPKIIIGEILHRGTGMCGSLAIQLRNILQQELKKNGFTVVSPPRSFIKIVGPHTITAKYHQQDNLLIICFTWKDDQEKIVHEFQVSSSTTKYYEASLLPNNAQNISKALSDLQDEKQDKALKLQMTTDRGTTGAIYRHGDLLRLHIQASKDCYLQIYYLQTSGQLVRIFPNDFHLETKIQANKEYIIPDENYSFDFVIDCTETSGMEIIKSFASLLPLPEISGENIGAGMRSIKIKPKELMSQHRRNPNIVEATCTILVEKINE